MSKRANGDVANIAWSVYQEDHNIEKLLDTTFKQVDVEMSLQLLLWLAIGSCDDELIKTLESRQVVLPNNPDLIFEAMRDFGDAPNVVEWLLNHGTKIDHRSSNDWTALHLACNSGYIHTVRLLVNYGSNVNTQTNCDGGWTPLMEACVSGNKKIVEFSGHGANTEIVNLYEGGTAREIAIKRGHLDIVEVLDLWSASLVNRKRDAWKHKRNDRSRDTQGK